MPKHVVYDAFLTWVSNAQKHQHTDHYESKSYTAIKLLQTQSKRSQFTQMITKRSTLLR